MSVWDTISYGKARAWGLVAMFGLIAVLAAFAYVIFHRQASAIRQIVSVEEKSLHRWYDVSALLAEAKDRLYDYHLGRIHTLAPVDFLVARAQIEVERLRQLVGERREQATIDELRDAIQGFRVQLLAYRRSAPPAGLNEVTARQAARMALLARTAVDVVAHRVAQKHEAILAASDLSQRLLVAGLVLAAMLTIFLAFVLNRALGRPVERLVAATESLAAGNFRHRVPVVSDDEIGRLGQAFNDMAQELERSRAELLRTKGYLENIVRSMINSLIVVDPTGHIETVNLAACRLLGYTAAELRGMPLASLFAPGYYEKFRFEELMSSAGSGQQESVLQRGDGKTVPMLISGSVIQDEAGEVQGMVLVGQDITVQAEAMRAGHLASLGELAAGVAHEINNPLNAMINYAQILLDELAEEGAVRSGDLLHRIVAQGDRVAVIVRSLLSFAREEDKAREAIQPAELVEETLAFSAMGLRKAGIKVEVRIADDAPAFRGHFQQLQQVLLNLLSNARDALNQKYEGAHPDKRLWIEVGRRQDGEGGWLAIEVGDAGVGIPAALLDKVKNPFFSTKPRGMGTGLGLAISHGIVADHGGRLLIDSVAGRYTRVTVLLPLEEA